MDFWLPLTISFILSFLAIKIVNPIAIKTGLVDYPCARKVHEGHIPLVGGIAIYLSIMLASVLFIEQSRNLNIYLVAAAFVLFLGVLDDRYDLPVKTRLVAQVIVASLMIFGTETHLSSLGYILGGFELKLGLFGIIVTIVAIIAGINAINMMDGIDGLAGALSLIAFAAIAFFLNRVANDWFLLPTLFIASLLAYLMFNLKLHKSFSKIFMGDSGNMLIGLSLVWLMVLGVNLETPAFKPVTALYIMGVPILDMATVIIRRLKSGNSPFSADRQHLHHLFEAAGYSRTSALVCISSFASLLAVLGCVAEIFSVPEWVMLATYIILFICYAAITQCAWNKLEQKNS
ncbi:MULTISPECIES: UDP-N-acetylglucosamine--undecaprenyl-phosphate N-acetylglucosaminephosphotransferase [Pseudoalteromonas]|uniref:UDP-GlcNAc:undecaprenyl-phosphate GlcNAc-1-phosphate transferase n=1 Tax=Pseudoalteromonas agarivorans DSM 14585 TaxID=1312369 RepID=A0ACA8DSQ9_9GAMM|nr:MULTISPECIES: UDP-N-acetylglucosamine--undecaprenyl-phosphate N-acetylglucosaminephosphotransferase [Pseudoalteromonas]ATC81049.1 UDP-GlcNAc:undecaprenyl-phosphate GlcNAc-1-phosphate transferase [Pseudoalteromonas agarivorans DSM 14585]KPZ52528.1 Undecaprenyl-phosphate alpha-N-acetylglucosaminyl 1-phosphate transferase [Pseudoalteromonas sp. P1-13-1a]MDC9521280.1 UDP-N-acetylglucosamine--undecaprenyl-phosphate N-acetylglucosaminephosphotransferase [Pseudoalteromonas sp. Angola-31]